jgi:hypothetical protein
VYPATVAEPRPTFIRIEEEPKKKLGWPKGVKRMGPRGKMVRPPDDPRQKSSVGASPADITNRQSRRDERRMVMGQDIRVADPATAADVIPEDADAETQDLAATVVRRTQRLLAANKVQPTLKDGLQAQQILDRRAEKAADRRFMLNLALAMAGGAPTAPEHLLPEGPKNVTEGEFEDVDLAPDHLRQG